MEKNTTFWDHNSCNAGDKNRGLEMEDSRKDLVNTYQGRYRDILISLRKIIQATDLHSRSLSKTFGLTGPQLVILEAVSNHEHISVTGLAKSISLRQATVTDIINRLVKKGYIVKRKSEQDKRQVRISLSEQGIKVLDQAPPPLQETFIERFSNLADWEQLMILSAFERVVNLMSAEKIDAAPILVSGPIDVETSP
jgi:DNA-binding MarR family transcriptional regulator